MLRKEGEKSPEKGKKGNELMLTSASIFEGKRKEKKMPVSFLSFFSNSKSLSARIWNLELLESKYICELYISVFC
jgi:hypothetical protein